MAVNINSQNINASGKKISLYEGEKEVGWTYLYFLYNDFHDEPFALIEYIFVTEEYRGQGLGSRLVQQAIAEAKERRCYKIIMTSRSSNTHIHQWYSKLGFTEHGKEFRMDIDPS